MDINFHDVINDLSLRIANLTQENAILKAIVKSLGPEDSIVEKPKSGEVSS